MKISNSIDVLEYQKKTGLSLDMISLAYESEKTSKSEERIVKYLSKVIEVMESSSVGGYNDTDDKYKGKIIGNDGIKLRKRLEEGKSLCGSTISKAAAYALSTMSVNASMGKVVASPTAGSCGVLPAVLMTLRDEHGFSTEQLVEGLLVANLVGSIIARNATISGAEGGCQAEIGTASAMAAAAAVHLSGGNAQQVFDSAAMTLKNILGLVCDPIAGLVESPCAKRNAMGSANALLCAEMALSGIKSVVPFDEVVDSMYRVGRALPPSLRETSRGGLAITPTGIRLQKEIFGIKGE